MGALFCVPFGQRIPLWDGRYRSTRMRPSAYAGPLPRLYMTPTTYEGHMPKSDRYYLPLHRPGDTPRMTEAVTWAEKAGLDPLYRPHQLTRVICRSPIATTSPYTVPAIRLG